MEGKPQYADEKWALNILHQVMQATMPKEAGDSDFMEDSDSDDIRAENDSQDESDGSIEADEKLDEDSEHSDALSLAENSDNEDLLGLDEELPHGLIDYGGSDTDKGGDESEWQGIEATTNKRKRGDEAKSQSRRKKLRSLPTFASYEDYAKLINEGPEDDI